MRRGRGRRRGAVLLNVTLAVAMLATLLTVIAPLETEVADDARDKVAAHHLSMVLEAGQRYFRDNRRSLEIAAAGSPQVVTASTLRSAGYLSPEFRERNGFQQDVSVVLAPNALGAVQAVAVSHGGSAIPERRAVRIAAFVGAGGGYVPAAASTELRGVGWVVPLSLLGGTVSVSAGRLGAVGVYAGDTVRHSFISRHRVPGEADAQRLLSGLDFMGSIDAAAAPGDATYGAGIRQADAVGGTNVYASEAVAVGGDLQVGSNLGSGGAMAVGGAASFAGAAAAARDISSGGSIQSGGSLLAHGGQLVAGGGAQLTGTASGQTVQASSLAAGALGGSQLTATGGLSGTTVTGNYVTSGSFAGSEALIGGYVRGGAITAQTIGTLGGLAAGAGVNAGTVQVGGIAAGGDAGFCSASVTVQSINGTAVYVRSYLDPDGPGANDC